MELANPYLLGLAALALPVLWLALRVRGSSFAVPSASHLSALRPTFRLRLARALPVLRVLAIALLAVGLARPRVGEVSAVIPAEGIDIALSLDISSSMLTANLAPGKNRLEATKEVIREFVKERQHDRIGLVVFQEDAIPLSPLSLDYDALDAMIADVEPGLLPDGTGIGVGLSTALNMLKDSQAATKIVILLTDGEHNARSIPPLDAAQLAKALRVRVYTIGVISEGAGGRGIDAELLREISSMTGGRYFVASTQQDLAGVYDEIATLETSGIERESYERYREYAPWFLGGAAALLLLEMLLRGTWLRRIPA